MIRRAICWLLLQGVRLMRRLDPYYRDHFDAWFQRPLVRWVQWWIQRFRTDQGLALAEEAPLANEQQLIDEITGQMSAFLHKHYDGKERRAERAGNTKTYGLVRAEFVVDGALPTELQVGLFAKSGIFPAYVRFGGPGPLVTPDIDNNGILSIGIKVMGVEGDKLMADERHTQDFLGISAPTFTTPDIVENLKLQREIYRDTPVWYFVNPFDSHYLDMLMQGLFARTHANPLELTYYSCVPFLFGEGRAVKFVIKPRYSQKSPVGKLTDNYLHEAMVRTLAKGEVVFDFYLQAQTDPHRMPIEDASVQWSERESPLRHLAELRIPEQQFDWPAQMAFANQLSFNPWHCLADHRPLGNQNRARRQIYLATSKVRQGINGEPRVEPTGQERFES